MKRWFFAVIALAVASFAGYAFAKPPGCPCSPCTCSPCHCGGGGGHSHGGVGLGVDLSGLINNLNRHNENTQTVIINDPNQPVSHSEPKPKKSDKSTSTTSGPFRDVKLTGPPAKLVVMEERPSAQPGSKP